MTNGKLFMEMLTCIIIDDDELDRINLEQEILIDGTVKLLDSCSCAIEALDKINLLKPDILFLDIDMPEINGLDLVKALGFSTSIKVFITSHQEFALQGFELKVFDFILKPLTHERFKDCIERISDFVRLKGKANAYDVLFENEKLIFKEGHNVVNLNTNEIIYLEAYGDYTKIVTKYKCHLTLATLSSFLASLPAGKFLRIHRSYVVAVDKVSGFRQKHIELGIQLLPIGKTFLKDTKKMVSFVV